MSGDEIRRVRQLRLQGYGYKRIATEVGVSRDSVRNYCKKNNLFGPPEVILMNQEVRNSRSDLCKYCGKTLTLEKYVNKRKFCSTLCRRKWWKEHPEEGKQNEDAKYRLICQYCKNEFISYGNKNRKYCSHDCYIKDRFWTEEELVALGKVKCK